MEVTQNKTKSKHKMKTNKKIYLFSKTVKRSSFPQTITEVVDLEKLINDGCVIIGQPVLECCGEGSPNASITALLVKEEGAKEESEPEIGKDSKKNKQATTFVNRTPGGESRSEYDLMWGPGSFDTKYNPGKNRG